jgi:hypothetical protein
MQPTANANIRLKTAAALVGLCVAIWPGPAAAYRPFNGTDAAVADPNEMEIEFQPVGTQTQGSDKSLVGPWAVVNYGFKDRWEAVFEGKGIVPVSPSGSFEVTEPAFSLKHVLRPGSLQDQTGPSIATNSASCCRRSMATAVSARAWQVSSRSDGIGARFTSMSPRR